MVLCFVNVPLWSIQLNMSTLIEASEPNFRKVSEATSPAGAGRQGKRPPAGGLSPAAGQYSLGRKMVLFLKYRVISASGKSVYSDGQDDAALAVLRVK
jgi:hypothetical protein